jgi:hypothetical protein
MGFRRRDAMSVVGQTGTSGRVPDWSVHSPAADMTVSRQQVRLVPKGDLWARLI